MSTLYLIRHGEPELRNVFLGSTNPCLSEKGLLEAQNSLQNMRFEALYSSPLKRARETAACIGPALIIPELAEMDFGEWDGLNWEQIRERWPDLAQRKSEDWFGVAPPGGESWTQFLDRIQVAVDRILAGPMPAGVVAHLLANAAIAHLADGRDPHDFHQSYCEVITVDVSDT